MSSRMKCWSSRTPTAFTSRGSIPGRSDRSATAVRRDLEKIDHLPDPDPVAPAAHVNHHDGSLVILPPRLLEEDVAIEHGEQGATDVDQAFDRVRHPRDAGGREARQDLTHDPCRGSANKRTDAKNDGM